MTSWLPCHRRSESLGTSSPSSRSSDKPHKRTAQCWGPRRLSEAGSAHSLSLSSLRTPVPLKHRSRATGTSTWGAWRTLPWPQWAPGAPGGLAREVVARKCNAQWHAARATRQWHTTPQRCRCMIPRKAQTLARSSIYYLQRHFRAYANDATLRVPWKRAKKFLPAQKS